MELANGEQQWYVGGMLTQKTTATGDRQRYYADRLHRDGDKPAVEAANGDRDWWHRGCRNRSRDLPAIDRANGEQLWYTAGQLTRHRHANGDEEWYRHGVRHRDGGLPAVVRADGHKEWHYDGKLDRMECSNGEQRWYHDGRRVPSPARQRIYKVHGHFNAGDPQAVVNHAVVAAVPGVIWEECVPGMTPHDDVGVYCLNDAAWSAAAQAIKAQFPEAKVDREWEMEMHELGTHADEEDAANELSPRQN